MNGALLQKIICKLLLILPNFIINHLSSSSSFALDCDCVALVAFSFNAGFTCYSFNTNSWAKLDISVDSRKRAVVELSAQSIKGHLVIIRTIRGFVHEEPCRVVQILPDTHCESTY